MERYDVVVVGAGLAGLHCTRLLAGHGLRTLLVDRKPSLELAVHTTGIFVRRSLDDFSLPPAMLGPPIRHVTLYAPSRRKLDFESPSEEFRIGRMGALYTRLLKDCQAAGAEWLARTGYIKSEPIEGGSLVHLDVAGEERTIESRFLVGADGANSRVARDLNLSANRRWIVGVEEVFQDVPLAGPPRLHCFLDRRFAPGYIAWIAEDGQSVHVGVGGYPSQFRPSGALDEFRATIGSIVQLRSAKLVERRSGRIPIGGILPRLASPRGLLIGDAAGAVSPLTAGGLDPCLRLSDLAAKVIWQLFKSGDEAHLAAYDGRQFRRAFRLRRALRTGFAWAGYNPLFEAGCALLRLPPARRLAEQVFFGRGSFPDVLNTSANNRPEQAAVCASGKAQNPKAVSVN